MLSSDDFYKIVVQCMQDTNVADPTFDDVKTCGEGSEGKELFHLFGQETKNLEPPHQYVPWITFNDVSNK